MNSADLRDYSECLISCAINDRHRVGTLLRCADSIDKWLRDNGVHPIRFEVSPHNCGGGFRIVYSFSNEYLLPFAKREKEFWRFADGLIMVDDDTTDLINSGQPLAGVSVDVTCWRLTITPHPDTLLDQFPGKEFWRAAAIAEPSIQHSRSAELYRQRVLEVSEALDSAGGGSALECAQMRDA